MTHEHAMDPIPPTYSFPPTQGPNAPAAGPRAVPTPEARAEQTVDRVEIGDARPQAQALSRLVAGKVERSALDDRPAERPKTPDAIGLYAHPADKNAAATGVTLGREIDVTG